MKELVINFDAFFWAWDWFIKGSFKHLSDASLFEWGADRVMLGVGRWLLVMIAHYSLMKVALWKRFSPETSLLKNWKHELSLTALTLGPVTGLVLAASSLLAQQGILQFHENNAFGEAYYWLSFPLCLLGLDTYFYFTHRLLHHPRFYNLFHSAHHRTVSTTPLTGTSFHPAESLIFYSYLIWLPLIMPISLDVLNFFSWFSVIFITMGHSGIDIWPSLIRHVAVARIWNGPLHHYMHHSHNQGNYSLFLNFWDWAFSTNNPNYIKSLYEKPESRDTKS